jgi:hypothetical protein
VGRRPLSSFVLCPRLGLSKSLNWKKIETVGRYMIEIWKAVGVDVGGKVEFLRSSKEIDSSPNEYWALFMDITRRTKLSSIIRSRIV